MKEREFHIDIGGGTVPDFFIKQSHANTTSQYIVLDPTIRSIQGKPKNLHFIKWQQDNFSSLPFTPHSISHVYMNNIFDELRTNGRLLDWSDTEQVFENGYYDSHEILSTYTQKELYKQLIISSRSALIPGGKLSITEPQENIQTVLDLCLEQGFSLVVKPTCVTDVRKSLWTHWLYDMYAYLEPHEGKYEALPTEFVVSVR